MTQTELRPTQSISTKNQLDDRLIRLIGIPGFGIVIPNLTGLFGELRLTEAMYWFGYAFFILLAALIWQGNRWLLFQQRKHLDWFSKPWRKLLILISANVFYTFPLTVGWIWLWYQLNESMPTDWDAIQVVTLMNVIAVIFVTHAYETVFLIQERESDALHFARANEARTAAELQALKNQIDPHFMFNSLNTLSQFIEADPKKALDFNEHLADVYRYILLSKERNLVWLSEELEFLSHYANLIRLRFGDSFSLDITGADDEKNEWLIPPISLQLLLENAVKHNQFDAQHALKVNIRKEGDNIIVSNNLRLKPKSMESTGQGLINLQKRYSILNGRTPLVHSDSHEFRVTLPLIHA
ncbi:MAG: histidine kinase [Flavobacteriales bacterium]